MSSIIDISNAYPIPTTPKTNSVAARTSEAISPQQEDSIEISNIGRSLANANDISSLNQARLQAVRMEIEKGTFETPERIHGTVDRLIQFLG